MNKKIIISIVLSVIISTILFAQYTDEDLEKAYKAGYAEGYEDGSSGEPPSTDGQTVQNTATTINNTPFTAGMDPDLLLSFVDIRRKMDNMLIIDAEKTPMAFTLNLPLPKRHSILIENLTADKLKSIEEFLKELDK